jgi:hypothetical protein
MFYEGFLQGMQSRAERRVEWALFVRRIETRRRSVHLFVDALSESFDRDNCLSRRTFGRIDTRDHGLAIHKDGAGAALGFFTANLGACETKSLAEKCREGLARDRLESVLNTIYCKRDLIIHRFSLRIEPLPHECRDR